MLMYLKTLQFFLSDLHNSYFRLENMEIYQICMLWCSTSNMPQIDHGNALKSNAELGAPGAFIWTFLDDCDHSFQCLSEEERDRHESKRETGRRQWDRMGLRETEEAQPSRALCVCVCVFEEDHWKGQITQEHLRRSQIREAYIQLFLDLSLNLKKKKKRFSKSTYPLCHTVVNYFRLVEHSFIICCFPQAALVVLAELDKF